MFVVRDDHVVVNHLRSDFFVAWAETTRVENIKWLGDKEQGPCLENSSNAFKKTIRTKLIKKKVYHELYKQNKWMNIFIHSLKNTTKCTKGLLFSRTLDSSG